jgi:hypothetical protein
VRRLLALAALLLAGCGAAHNTSSTGTIPVALLREARPVGVGARFRPPVSGRPLGACRGALGSRFGVHVEVFAANRVVIIPAGIGRGGATRCYGALATLAPTGVVLVRRGERLSLAALFRSWGQPLSSDRLVSFRGAVRAFVDGTRWPEASGTVPLTYHSEIVLEVGPYVPPHRSFAFPPGE